MEGTTEATARLRTLIARVDELIRMLGDVTSSHSDDLANVHPTHRSGAENILHYAALHTQDLRSLQTGLADLGATRLSATEPAVLGRLQAARNGLAAFAGEELPYDQSELIYAFARADETLAAHADRLLGSFRGVERSRIMVTLPDAVATAPDLADALVAAGMDLARINSAHGDQEQWQAMMDNVTAAAHRAGREIRIAVDLAGPRLRTGPIQPGPRVGRARVTRTSAGEVTQPARLWLTPKQVADPLAPPEVDGRPALTVAVDEQWLDALRVDDAVRVNDARGSKRKLIVVEVTPDESRRAGRTAAVLCEGSQNVYVAEGSMLEANWIKVRAHGIPPTDQKLRLNLGGSLWLTESDAATDPSAATPRVGCTPPEAVRALKVGDRVLFGDGQIEAEAIRRAPQDDGGVAVLLRVTRATPGGAHLGGYTGINLPDTELPVASLTAEDRATLAFAAGRADLVGVSFVRTSDDVATILDVLSELHNEARIGGESARAERIDNLGVMLKIETMPAYESLPEILLAGMQRENFGVMIARGDLAVELGFERMAEVPGVILAASQAAHVPTIMATQVLENWATTGRPTRAEITDAAFALRAEAVMLNEGPHIPEAIELLRRMSRLRGRS